MVRADQALKSLPWADHDNSQIVIDEQLVRVHVNDMSKFDQKELIKAFVTRKLTPAFLEEILPLPDPPPVSDAVLANAALKPVHGEWRTDESAKRKFWLTVQKGTIRLHTAKVGHSHWMKSNIIDAGKDWIEYRTDADKNVRLTYRMDGEFLTITVPSPGVFQGKFELSKNPE